MANQEWSVFWPSEPGSYWFYGKKWGDGKLRLHHVEVFRGSNSLIYVTEGHFIYRSEAHIGLWTKAVLPKVPSEKTWETWTLSLGE